MRISICVVASMLLLVTNSGYATNQLENSEQFNKVIQKTLDTWRESNNVGAASLSISTIKTPFIVDFYSGTSSKYSSQHLNSGSLTRIDSITKSFTSALLLKLADKDLVNLSNPITVYLPQYTKWSGVSVKQLLNMTSGLYDYTQSPTYKDVNKKWNFRKHWSPEELIAIAYSEKPYFRPGGSWHYSNTNYVLASMIIRSVTGHSAEYEFNHELLDEASYNLTNTYYLPYSSNDLPASYANEHIPQRLIHGYDNTFDGTMGDFSAFATGGAMVSSSHDLVKWARLLFNGKILSKQSLHEMMSLVATSGTNAGQPVKGPIENGELAYGLGISELRTGQPQLGNIWWHSGGGFGYHALFVWVPKYSLVIAMTDNEQDAELKPDNPVLMKVYDLVSKQFEVVY